MLVGTYLEDIPGKVFKSHHALSQQSKTEVEAGAVMLLLNLDSLTSLLTSFWSLAGTERRLSSPFFDAARVAYSKHATL